MRRVIDTDCDPQCGEASHEAALAAQLWTLNLICGYLGEKNVWEQGRKKMKRVLAQTFSTREMDGSDGRDRRQAD